MNKGITDRLIELAKTSNIEVNMVADAIEWFDTGEQKTYRKPKGNIYTITASWLSPDKPKAKNIFSQIGLDKMYVMSSTYTAATNPPAKVVIREQYYIPATVEEVP